MNARDRPPAAAAPSLAGLAYAVLAGDGAEGGAEAEWLAGWRRQVLEAEGAEGDVATFWHRWAEAPPESDVPLHALAVHLELGLAELLALALATSVELDLMAGRALAWLQTPTGGAWPGAGLVATVANRIGDARVTSYLAELATGPAREAGALQLAGDARPLPEQALRVPTPLALALGGLSSLWPGVRTAAGDEPPLPPSLQQAAACYARALAAGVGVEGGASNLAIRCGHPKEAQALARTVARGLDAEVALIEGEPPAGLGPWLWLTGRVPVLCRELAPGEQASLPALHGYAGPLLVAAGPDGGFERDGTPVTNWRVGVPAAGERIALWQTATGDPALAAALGRRYRHSSARIHDLARAGRLESALRGDVGLTFPTLARTARSGAAADLGTLAQLLPEAIADDALVLPPSLGAELLALEQRCTGRDGVAASLGPAARARHRPGVRALFYGPSGTGKTLAVGWLATRLGLPLYRVDLASVTSKYIGETEKNLAKLFARAEHAEVILMFDEADALFGKRTEVKDANDRFANAQTNYLLQRIESFEGIAVLTSNSRARFDSAFTRRLDAIVEFPLPAPEERRALVAGSPGSPARPRRRRAEPGSRQLRPGRRPYPQRGPRRRRLCPGARLPDRARTPARRDGGGVPEAGQGAPTRPGRVDRHGSR